jgi:hypothetical protein
MSDFDFSWNGDEIEREVMEAIDDRMVALGGFIVEHMQGYSPVDTGAMRAGMHDQYDYATHTLYVYSPASQSVWQEFGTRNMKPHPYMRPTILDVGPTWMGMPIEWELALRPPAQISEPLRATSSGFRLPRSQKLTAAQTEHVRKNLSPVSRSFAGKFKRRGIGFKVVGPKRKKF